jgi:hypothetical protein
MPPVLITASEFLSCLCHMLSAGSDTCACTCLHHDMHLAAGVRRWHRDR